MDLIKEDFDVVILRHIPKHQTLKIRKLYQASINIYCTPDYIKRYGLPETHEDLQKHFVVGAINDHGLIDSSILSVTTPSGEQVVWNQFARIYTNSLEPVLKIARDGHAIVGGTDLLYRDELERGELLKVMPGYTFAKVEFYLVRLSNNKNPLIDGFIAFIENCFNDISLK
jgi:DNA-binding transcriptional LysR family regulator